MSAQQISATGVISNTAWVYDTRNRLQSETQANGAVLSYQYDDNGNRTQIKVVHAGSTQITATTAMDGGSTGNAGAITTYAYDELNRLLSVTDASGTTTYGYDAVGNRTSISYPNGTSQVYRYNNLNRLITLETYGANGTLVEQYDYTLNATGRRTFIDELDGRSSAYEYDLLNRLTKETISDAQTNRITQYTYDKVGNRLSETIDGVTNSFVYDLNDRLQSSNNASYLYDNNGNTLSTTEAGVITTYAYNAKNQLQSATHNAGTTQFAYNIDGIRTQKINGAITTNFVVDSNQGYAQVLNEFTGTNRTVYTYGDDLISQRKNNQTHFYHYDGLGSTRQLSNSTGNFTDSYDYQAFGEILNQTGSTENNYLFTGEQFDQTLNQYYLRARYYNQQTGRFTQQDTWMGNSQDPITLHKYLYANVDPVGMIDPSGNMSLGEMGAALNISGTLRVVSANTLRRYVRRAVTQTLKDLGSIKKEVRKCLRSKKSCDIDIPVLVVGGDNSVMADHIMDAQMGNGSNWLPSGFLHSYNSRKHTDWYLGRPGCTQFDMFAARAKYGPKVECDEFPMNAMDLGGPKNHPAWVSLRYVPYDQNKSVGAMWGRLVGASGMKKNPNKKALVVAWREISLSFWLPAD